MSIVKKYVDYLGLKFYHNLIKKVIDNYTTVIAEALNDLDERISNIANSFGNISTQPKLLPDKFNNYPMYEILCPYDSPADTFDTDLIPDTAIVIGGSVFGNGYCESLNSYTVPTGQVKGVYHNVYRRNNGPDTYLVNYDGQILVNNNKCVVNNLIQNTENWISSDLETSWGISYEYYFENDMVYFYDDSFVLDVTNQWSNLSDIPKVHGKIEISNIVNSFSPEYALVRYYVPN